MKGWETGLTLRVGTSKSCPRRFNALVAIGSCSKGLVILRVKVQQPSISSLLCWSSLKQSLAWEKSTSSLSSASRGARSAIICVRSMVSFSRLILNIVSNRAAETLPDALHERQLTWKCAKKNSLCSGNKSSQAAIIAVSRSETCPGGKAFTLRLTVYMCLEKLFYKIFFFCDFDMILLWFLLWFPYGWFYVFLPVLKTVMISIWFCYGPGVLHFFLMKFVMAGRIFFVKKNIWSLFIFFTFQNWKKTINYLYLKNKKIWIKSKKCLSC